MPQLILKRIDLLGNDNLRCLPVIQDEGSRSYKAIAFISDGNPKTTRLTTKRYSTLRRSLQQKQFLSESRLLVIREYFNKKLGDEKWIK